MQKKKCPTTNQFYQKFGEGGNLDLNKFEIN